VRAGRAASTAPGPTVVRSSDPVVALTNYGTLRAALGDPVLEPELLERALTHRSYAYEHGGLPNNERLEFLGDSVLGVVVTETPASSASSNTSMNVCRSRICCPPEDVEHS